MAIHVHGDFDRVIPELILDIHQTLAILDKHAGRRVPQRMGFAIVHPGVADERLPWALPEAPGLIGLPSLAGNSHGALEPRVVT
jgi:hypothetical protein